MRKSVMVLDITRIDALGPHPTVVVTAMFCCAEKLMLDVPGKSPLGQTLANPPPSGPAIVRLIMTPFAVVGTPLALAVVSMARGVFDEVGCFGPTSVGSRPGRES